MCDPLTIAGAVMTVGGAAANYAANQEVQSARNGVMSAERIRQQNLDRQADAINQRSRERYQNFGDQQDAKAKTLGDMFTEPAQVTGGTPVQPTDVMPASNSTVTNNEIVNKGDTAKAFTTQQGKALGTLRSFGDLFGGIGRDQAEDAMKVGQVGNFKQGSSNVEQLELLNAGHAGDGTAFLGDVLSGLGKVGVSAGLSGGSISNMFGATPKAVAAGAAFPIKGTTAFQPYMKLY